MKKRNLNVDIEIDGGINFENCTLAKEAGANILVSGSTIFKENKGDLKKNIEILKKKLIDVWLKRCLFLFSCYSNYFCKIF